MSQFFSPFFREKAEIQFEYRHILAFDKKGRIIANWNNFLTNYENRRDGHGRRIWVPVGPCLNFCSRQSCWGFSPSGSSCPRWWARCCRPHFGHAVLNVIQETEFIKDTAEIGVIVMMFCAGMETDVNELKHSGKAGPLSLPSSGVLVPIGGGFALAYFFNQPGVIEFGRHHPVFCKHVHRRYPHRHLGEHFRGDLKELGKLKPARATPFWALPSSTTCWASSL